MLETVNSCSVLVLHSRTEQMGGFTENCSCAVITTTVAFFCDGTDELTSLFHQMALEKRDLGSLNTVRETGPSCVLIYMENVFSVPFAFPLC